MSRANDRKSQESDDSFVEGIIGTAVATHAIVAGDLPRLNYPTLADIVLISCYVTAVAVIAIGIVVRNIEAAGDIKRARAIDRFSMWLLPVTTAIVLAIATLILWT